jgi:TolB protein
MPEHSDLVFMSNRDGNAEIYLLANGSADWINLTKSDASENWPQWSPDGSRIAFQSNLRGNLDIWVMNADGTDPIQLTDDAAHDYLPAWSPDGTQITFASWRAEPGDGEPSVHTYIMNADGSAARRLIADSPGTSSGAEWSPDGRGFLLNRKIGDQGADIFLTDSVGNVLRRLTDDPFSNGAPVYSPDGTQIAFYSDRGEQSDIVVMDVDGSKRRTVVTGGQNYYPRWSPDGRWLVYTAAMPGGLENDYDVLAVPVDGDPTPITLAGGPGREAEGQWRPRR